LKEKGFEKNASKHQKARSLACPGMSEIASRSSIRKKRAKEERESPEQERGKKVKAEATSVSVETQEKRKKRT